MSRRQGGTLSSRYRSNGYVLDQQGQLSGRLREQGRSHTWIGYDRESQVDCQAASRASFAPTGLTGV
ncbi:hypothetical protein EMIT0P228_310001 [Pseudomonas brassicacearum]